MDPLRFLWFRTPAFVFLFLLLIHGARSSHIPGITPRNFRKGDLLQVKVKGLTSMETLISYSYYSLPHCCPKEIVDSTENDGEFLRGNHYEISPYTFRMGEPQRCNVVCRIKLNAKQAKDFQDKIKDWYRVNMTLDDLPLVVPIWREDQDSPFYVHGLQLGLIGQYWGKEDRYFIYNHLAFTVKYYRDLQTDTTRIVGFEVRPWSMKHEYEGEWNESTRLTTCDDTVVHSGGPQEVAENEEILFTYDVEFQETDIKWESRWDTYLLRSE